MPVTKGENVLSYDTYSQMFECSLRKILWIILSNCTYYHQQCRFQHVVLWWVKHSEG
jgi:hypothetical protein